MPSKANFNTFVIYKTSRVVQKASIDNLLGVNGNNEYNGYLSEHTQRLIKGLVSNYSQSIFHAEANGLSLIGQTNSTCQGTGIKQDKKCHNLACATMPPRGTCAHAEVVRHACSMAYNGLRKHSRGCKPRRTT